MFLKILSHHHHHAASSAFRTRYASSTIVRAKFPPTGISEKQGSTTFIARLISSKTSNELDKTDASTSNIPFEATQFHHSAPASAWIASKSFSERPSLTGYGSGNLKFPCFQPTTATILRGMREKQGSLSIARFLSSQANHEPAKRGVPTSNKISLVTFIGGAIIHWVLFGFVMFPVLAFFLIPALIMLPLAMYFILPVFVAIIIPLVPLLLCAKFVIFAMFAFLTPMLHMLGMLFQMLGMLFQMLGFLIISPLQLLLSIFYGSKPLVRTSSLDEKKEGD